MSPIMTVPYENIKPTQMSCSPWRKCFFCIPLRIGCLCLGYISLFLNLLITMFFVGSLIITGILTHGFRYIHTKETQNGEVVSSDNPIDQTELNTTIIKMLFVGFFNFAWLLLNVVLLVGLHKKRPGPIKIHVAAATLRIFLSIVGQLTMDHVRNLTIYWIEIVFSAYFIMMYLNYAVQLERENKSNDVISQQIISDMVFTYPKNIDKKNLTEKLTIE